MSDEIKIESGIPIPKTKGRHALYPWKILEVGQSFAIPIEDRLSKTGIASQASKNFAPKRFVSRVIKYNGQLVRRIWRTE